MQLEVPLTANMPIAIVGMGCRFAGAPDLQSFWKLTLEGRDAFTEPPLDRWDTAVFHDTSKRATDKSYAPTGGFIDDIRSFPALAFGLPPRRVEVMDPQQRFTIEVSRQAIEDAGYTPSEMPYRTGAYVGMTASEYRTLMASRMIAQYMATGAFGRAPEDMTAIIEAVERIVPSRPFTAPGALANMAAAAVAQELDLHGPAYTTDAACASAMMAIADGVAQLRAGTIDAAVAGGAYVCITPEHHIAFSRIGAMSAQGKCLPFDEAADGFVQGDGVAMIVLKRLEDAEQDGDRVYAVINGIAVNNDGRGDGPMAPVSEGQAEVVRAAWRDANVSMDRVGYLECHGTGTDVGDVAEFRGLQTAFGDEVREAWLGSSKANVGHTMAAAGVTGMIRAALAIHHRTIPPMANFKTPKGALGIEETPWNVPVEPVPWAKSDRIAGVSSFGFGGTNAHAVLVGVDPEEETPPQAELVLISGPDEPTLRRLAAATADQLREDPSASVAGVARAWAVRMAQPQRVALVVTTRDELIAALDEVASGGRPSGSHMGVAPDEAPKVAFLYPGQGSQRTGMLAGIRDRFQVVAETLGTLQRELKNDLPVPLTHLLYPERRHEPVDDATASAQLTDTANCQPALLSCGIALTELLGAVGVQPAVVVGHSLGEFTAAAVGGVLAPADAARFVAARGRAMAELQGDHGAMAAVMADRQTADGLLVDGAIIANVNHPRQLVVSGSTDAVAAVVANATAGGVKAVALDVSHGFHSPVLASLDADALLSEIELHDPVTTVASGIASAPYADAADARSVFARHATSPVLFTDALQQCVDAGANLFLQVGAGGPLAAFARGSLRDVEHHGILSLAGTDDSDGGRSLLETLGRLWIAGVPVDPRAITEERKVASLPPTLYDRQEYWAVKDEPQLALNLKGFTPRVRETPQSKTPNAPTTAAPGVAPSAATVGDQVLAVVAKVSAYPLAALKPSMTLVDDLGFDSLMVNDLATGLSDAFPQMDGIPQELFINRPTVQDLIDHVETSGQGGTTRVTDDDPLTSYAPVWRATELPAFRQRRLKTNTRVLVAGTGPLADALSRALDKLGCRVQSCSIAEAAKAEATQAIFWLPATDDLPTIGDVLAAERRWPDLAAPLIAALDRQANLDATPDLITLFKPSVWAAGAAGVARSLAREWPTAVCKAMQIELDETGAILERTVAEWLSPDRTVDVRLTPAARMVLGFDAAMGTTGSTIGPQDTVLVTGGTRGIGAKLGARLAERGATVLLLGRGEPSDEAQKLIDEGKGKVVAVAADVTDRAAISAAIEGYTVTALVHSAGVLADGALGSVHADKGQLARDIKVGGWLNAIAACGPSLQVAVGIGSWAGRFGNRHQAHYGAANALLASLAEVGHNGTRTVVGEFGPWTSSEMVQTIPSAVLATMRKEGVDLVGDEPGLIALMALADGFGGAAVQGRELAWTTREVHLEHTLSTQSHPYLLDHAIEGTPVLPLAAAADLLAAGAQPGVPFELLDLRLFRGITVSEPVSLTVVVRGDRAEIRTGDRGTLAYRATVRPLLAPVDDPGPSAGGQPSELALSEFYGGITFHGPLLQGITEISAVGEGFIRGRVRTGSPDTWVPGTNRAAFTIDPLVLDSAMQLSGIVAWTRFGRAGTPIGIGRYVQLAPLPEGELIAEVTYGEQSDDSDRFSGTITLRTLDGELLVVATDVAAELRKVEAADAGSNPLGDFEIKPEYIDISTWPEAKDLNMRLDGAQLMGIRNPYFAVHEGTAKNTTQVAGRELVNYSSYNYLGLSGDPRVVESTKSAIDQFGTSVSASRVASGERPFHGTLEKLLAKCQGTDDSVVFTAGHATNVTTIGHLMKPDDLVMHDELIHDSALQGIKLSGASRRAFKHDDPADLERQLRELRSHYKKVLIVVEGVYSMDGDICDLPAYIAVKKKYGCLLMVDEAHSFGIVGKTGQGVREHFDIDGHEVDLWMGTLSKSLASCGGWIAASDDVIRYLKYTAPGFVFSAGITPANGVAGLRSLELMLEEPWRVEKLQRNALVFHDTLTELGLDTGPARGESAVVPVVTGNSMHALLLSQRLNDQGINVQPIVYPAVADDAARLRFFLSSTHTEEQLVWTAKRVAETLAEVRAEFPTP